MKRLFTLYKKEMLDVIRDKKTIIIMILVPLILYPLMFFAGMQIASMVSQESAHKAYRVSLEGVSKEEELRTLLTKEEDEREYYFIVKNKIDAYLEMQESEGKLKFQIYYNSSIRDSQTASTMLEKVLEDYQEQLRKEKIKSSGLDLETTLYPIESELKDLSSQAQTAGYMFGSIIPMLMIVSILLGAIYPAIDLTAGEKERGTMETLLTLPASSYELIMSKLLAVSTLAMISAILNFLSMAIMGFLVFQSLLMGDTKIEIHLVTFLPAVLLALLAVMTFSLLVSVLSILISIFAKTFKEAENYSTPLLLVIMLTSYVGFLPNIELNTTLSAVPVVNVVLLIKGLFSFQYELSHILIVLFSNVFYSLIGVFLLGKVFSSERLLFGEEGSIQLFENRRNIKEGQMPSIPDAIFLLACCLMVMIYLGAFLQRKFGMLGNSMMQSLFVILSCLFAWYIKADKKKLFSLRVPKPSKLLGGLLLWVGTFLIMMLLGVVLTKLMPESVSEVSEKLGQYMQELSTAEIIVMFAVVPAICEETLFRGFIFGTLKERIKPWQAVVLTAAVFGLYHMSVVRFVTTGILGLALTFAVYQSGSIFVSMLMHALNNTVSVLTMCYPDWFETHLAWLIQEELSGTEVGILIAGAVAAIILGVLLLLSSFSAAKIRRSS